MTHILVTNDDGVFSPGLLALKGALERVGRVSVIAPDRNRSAIARMITIHDPLHVEQVELDDGSLAYATDGTPVDCVRFAMLGLVGEIPDVVVSGINMGLNLGDDVTYSGTVACAFEGTLLGVKSIAFSLDYVRDAVGTVDWSAAQGVAGALIAWAKEHPPAPDTLWNVNVPAGTPRGFRATRMGRRRYGENIVEKIDPRGKPYYWIGGTFVDTKADGTDLLAVAEGYVSVTPLHMDMTDYRALADLDGLGVKLASRPEGDG